MENFYHNLIPRTWSRLSRALSRSLQTWEDGAAAWRPLCWRMPLWSIPNTSQLLLFRQAKAVREEEFQFNSIISGLYWYITLFHSGWIMLYFTSWSQYPWGSIAGTCLWLCDAGWASTVWMVNTWTGTGMAMTRDVVFSCLWTRFYWIMKRITRHTTGLGTVPGFESTVKA